MTSTNSKDDIELLERVLDGTGELIAGVREEQRAHPTPCEDFDVAALLDHMVGGLHMFEAGSHGRRFEGDAAAYRCGDDPAAEFRSAARSVVDGWRQHGVDRNVVTMNAEMPGEMVLSMTLMEYLTHGWDLATATGQTVPYREDDAAAVLERAVVTLPDQYRGEGQPFGHQVPVPDDAPAVDRMVAFMGRDPAG